MPTYLKKMHLPLPAVFMTIVWMLGSCTPDPVEIPLPTQICVKVQHHHQPIPGAKIYIKYNADSFPGYQQAPGYYDAMFTAGSDARGCINAVPEGRHWLVAFGYDSLYFPHDVRGSMQVDVSLNQQPKVDTLLYISE